MLKRLFSIITISLVLTGSFFSVYNFKCPVFADDSLPSGYTPVTDDMDLAYAFNAYCKSRDLDITSTVPGASITYIYNYIKEYCSAFGYNIDSMQEQLFKSVNDPNTPGVVKWYMKTGLIGMYNDIFAQLIRENDLEVGDSVDNDEVYNGKIYGDTLLYVVSHAFNNYATGSGILQRGTSYLYSNETLCNYVPNVGDQYIVQLDNSDHRYQLSHQVDGNIVNGSGYPTSLDPSVTYVKGTYNNQYSVLGYWCLVLTAENKIKCGFVTYRSNGEIYIYRQFDFLNNDDDAQSCVVYITTNNTTINNNNYEGDTIINNNGDVNNYPDNPDNPDIPDPNPGPTPDPPTIPDSGGWQDFSLPDMPNDWLIYGMEKKFPFDIPFNILFALSLLNHEPEIPKFEGDIDLQVCTWHYDIDLTPFDDIATILRKFEVLGFIIGLAILTKNLINWG